MRFDRAIVVADRSIAFGGQPESTICAASEALWVYVDCIVIVDEVSRDDVSVSVRVGCSDCFSENSLTVCKDDFLFDEDGESGCIKLEYTTFAIETIVNSPRLFGVARV